MPFLTVTTFLLTIIFLDGVTVAKAITLKDKFENLGARYVPMSLPVSHSH